MIASCAAAGFLLLMLFVALFTVQLYFFQFFDCSLVTVKISYIITGTEYDGFIKCCIFRDVLELYCYSEFQIVWKCYFFTIIILYFPMYFLRRSFLSTIDFPLLWIIFYEEWILVNFLIILFSCLLSWFVVVFVF